MSTIYENNFKVTVGKILDLVKDKAMEIAVLAKDKAFEYGERVKENIVYFKDNNYIPEKIEAAKRNASENLKSKSKNATKNFKGRIQAATANAGELKDKNKLIKKLMPSLSGMIIVLSVLLIILCFTPSFYMTLLTARSYDVYYGDDYSDVNYYDQYYTYNTVDEMDHGISVFQGAFGYSPKNAFNIDVEVVEPNTSYLLLFAIPLAIMIFWLVFAGSGRVWVYLTMILGVVADFIAWGRFKESMSSTADEWLGGFKTGIGYDYSLVLLCVLGFVIVIYALLMIAEQKRNKKVAAVSA